MRKYKVVNTIFLIAIIGLLAGVIFDYNQNKVIPNFFFMDKFGLEYVTAYWAGIGTILVLVPTLLNILMVRMEQVSNEHNNKILKEKEELLFIKRNLDRSIANLDSNNSERQCLSDIRDIEEAIDKQILEPRINTENSGMLLADDLVIVLSDYLHSLLKDKKKCVRADARYLLRYLYSTTHIIDFCEYNDLHIGKFKDEYLYLETLNERNLYTLSKATFENVTFDSTNSSFKEIISNFIFRGSSLFKNCIFKGDNTFKIHNNLHLYFDNCIFYGSVEFNSRNGNNEYSDIIINKCTFNNFTSLGYLNLRSIKIKDSVFSSATKFSDMSVSDVEIEGNKFFRFFDMQQSNIKSMFYLLNSSFEDDCFLTGSRLPKYGTKIYGLKFSKESIYPLSFSATIVYKNEEYDLEQGMLKSVEEDGTIVYRFEKEKI
ncbi:hypothetical protein [Enterococcus crotali]|uniref:hypothetical protein n=1 Tax=Enterococcus crotali TaxID=1453587 RepID=UPI00046F6005|nr:hypothetical protein [Enterococcus crotali]